MWLLTWGRQQQRVAISQSNQQMNLFSMLKYLYKYQYSYISLKYFQLALILIIGSVCDKDIKIKPNFEQAKNNLRVILELIEDLDKAQLNFKKAIKIDADNSEFHYNLGNVLFKLSKFSMALYSISFVIMFVYICINH